MHTALLLMLLAQADGGTPQLPAHLSVGFADTKSLKAKILVCVRTKHTEIICRDFDSALEENNVQIVPKAKKQVDL